MPFYEYAARDKNKSCSNCVERFEEMQSIKAEPLLVCPECGNEVQKLVSLIAGYIDKDRQMNQYNICKGVKYWRDQNGVRHKVTASDGHYKSASTGKKVTASPEEIKRRKKAT